LKEVIFNFQSVIFDVNTMSDDYKPVLRAGSDPLVFFKYPGEGSGPGYARGHVMATAMARNLRDGELVFMGANSLIPMAGTRLAQLTHAPNLTMMAGASGGVNTLLEPLAPSSGDYANLVAEAVMPFNEVLMLLAGGRADVFFVGGLQVDRRGNCNLVRVGPANKPRLRGPGSAAIPWAHRARRTIIYTTTHDKRVFVPRVDFVSMPGWSERQGHTHNGPELVVTPMAIMDFTEAGDMRLVSVHPGVTLDEVRDNTGFDLAMPEGDLPATPEPTTEELQLMRGFDPDGLLSIVI
jgi:glutaconate CoA-transferase subunit B